jgi:hypothetical protein
VAKAEAERARTTYAEENIPGIICRVGLRKECGLSECGALVRRRETFEAWGAKVQRIHHWSKMGGKARKKYEQRGGF